MPTSPSHYDPRRVDKWAQHRRAVGQNIRKARIERELTQERLADECGVDRTLLVAVESGRRSVLYERLFDIADALNVPITELFRDP